MSATEKMLADITGFCGAELLPHATLPDSLPAPIICTEPPHKPRTWHANNKSGTRWSPVLST